MMSSSVSSSNAFIPVGKTFATSASAKKTTTATTTNVVQQLMDPSFSRIILQQAAASMSNIAAAADDISSIDNNNELLFKKVDEILDFDLLSSATTVTTTATESESSSTSSSLEEQEDENHHHHHFSLRKVLNVLDDDDDDDNNNYPTIGSASSAEELLLQQFPKIVGHRGSLYEELENTREGFTRCHDMGCDGVELDVFKIQRTSKNVNNVNRNRKRNNSESNDDNDDNTTLIVFHGGGTDENPGDLLDYCGIDGSILDYNYETEVREKLTFNTDSAEFPCPIEKIRNGEIPTLEEVLVDAKTKNDDSNNNSNSNSNSNKKRMHITIELKGPDVVQDVLELVDSLGVADMCSYSSFDFQKLRLLRQLKPDRDPTTGEHVYKTGALYNNVDADGCVLDFYPSMMEQLNGCDIIDRALEVGASEVHLKYDTCTMALVERIHAAGLGSMAWVRGPIGMNEDFSTKYFDVGNEDLAMYETLVQTGVQQLCVNRPDVLIELRNKMILQLRQEQEQQQVQQQQKSILL